jgi:uncharacterized membrane protein YbaN (DUF454 family)
MSTPQEQNGERPSATVGGTRGPLRWLLLGLGLLLTSLAAIGAFLPVLPTTPFLLLAGACFIRSSPRFHARLKRAPIFGTYVDQWERDRSVPAAAKLRAYVMIALTFSYSIWAVDGAGLRIGLALVGLALVVFLIKLPTTDESND